MHNIAEFIERTAHLFTFVGGIAMWLTVTMLVALILVSNRLIDEVLQRVEDEEDDE